MVRRNNLLTTDAVREVKNTFSRFLSILVLSALAVAFLSGLRATAPDMKYTADNYFDRTHMMDASVISTLGITDEDLEALAEVEGVEEVEGMRTVDATAVDCIVSIRSVPEKLNLLEAEAGRLPQGADECVTDPLLLAQLGLEIGETLTVTPEEGDENALVRTAYTVVGTVRCPLYAGTDRGITSLGDGSLDGIVFVPGENFTTDYHSIAYLTGTGLAALDCYSQAYDEAAEALLDRLETLGAQRAQLRYDQVVGSAQAALDNAKTEAEARLAEAQAELDSVRAQLDQGWQDYKNAQAALTQKVSRGRAELESAAQALNSAQAEYDAGLAQYNAGLAESKARLDAEKKALDEVHAQLNQALTAIIDGWADYHSSAAALDQAEKAGRAELERTLAELNRGEEAYANGQEAYLENQAKADREIAAAQARLEEVQTQAEKLGGCQWYVLGRSANSGFTGYAQDAGRVSNLASVSPIIFFLVAALACLTTMTHMVEEQRTQIGVLKALGFSRLAISRKYLGYAIFASLSGSLLGLGLGCTLIPAVIANAFRILYDIPGLDRKPQPGLWAAAVAAAVLCTAGAALWACLSALMDTPANLMRPKAPKAGRRILLERVKPLWSRLSFTWKVTMRNLFRYQKRFWMTVIGIGGCTALIVTGFGLHDSIFSILEKQFDKVSVYDTAVGLDTHITEEELSQVTGYLDSNENVDRWLACRKITADASAGDQAFTAYLFAVEDEDDFHQLIDLRERKSGDQIKLSLKGVVITEKLSELLDLRVGDTITLEGDQRMDATVTAIAENYVHHYVYMTEDFYEELFREPAEETVILLAYGDGVDAGSQEETSVALMKLDGVSSCSDIGTIRASFTDSMRAIDHVVIIIIASAAALAFVVLYNLTNINITERVRELATLKVLGFYDREISAYVCRENLFLTIFGILLGLVMGRFLHAWVVLTVEIDMVMFGRTAPAYAYLLAAALTALFSVIVNVAAHFRLKKVDMVESLKTTE